MTHQGGALSKPPSDNVESRRFGKRRSLMRNYSSTAPYRRSSPRSQVELGNADPLSFVLDLNPPEPPPCAAATESSSAIKLREQTYAFRSATSERGSCPDSPGKIAGRFRGGRVCTASLTSKDRSASQSSRRVTTHARMCLTHQGGALSKPPSDNDESRRFGKRPSLMRNYSSTAPYRRFRRPKSSTASKRSFLVKSGQSLGVTYISV